MSDDKGNVSKDVLATVDAATLAAAVGKLVRSGVLHGLHRVSANRLIEGCIRKHMRLRGQEVQVDD